MIVNPVNVHDSLLLDQSFTNLLEIADDLNWDIPKGTGFTGDPGFDSWTNRKQIIIAGFTPIIKPNLRGLKDREKINRILNEFEDKEDEYKERHKIERCNAWEDKYRKVVIRYEKLQCTSLGSRYPAHTMINFRWLFGKNTRKL